MFNLYFTNWDNNGLPIANGKAELDHLIKNTIRPYNLPTNVNYFNKYQFESMCKIANYEYIYTNNFVDNFIFLIEYELETPIFELLVPLASILTEEIVTAINKNGYLVFLDNEGWLNMPKILKMQAVDLGVNIDRILYITCNPTTEDIFWNYAEELCFRQVTTNKYYNKINKIVSKKPTKLFTSLAGSSNHSKIRFLNSIVENNLFTSGNISLIKIKREHFNYLHDNLLVRYPITIDSSLEYDSNFFNTIPICSNSYINIVHEPANESGDGHSREDVRPSTVSLNTSLFTSAISKRPFIAVSHVPNKLSFYRSLGYKTFDNYFSEEYDLIEDSNDRLIAIIKLLKDLGKKDLDTLLVTMLDTLDHNFNHFFRKNNRSSHTAVTQLRNKIYAN